MDFYTKNGLLFIIQVDHLSGENLGPIIQYFYNSGASNVQVVSTITKKNRPGHLFLVDCKAQYADSIEEIIVRELTSGGWHRINTEHRHLSANQVTQSVVVNCDSGSFDFTVEGKQIGEGQSNIRPEHENCVALKDEIFQKYGIHISLNEIYYKISEILKNNNKKEIEI